MTFIEVAETSEIPLGQMKVVKVTGKEVVIANVNNVFYTLENSCTHMHG